MLTIGIPTWDRARKLEGCLDAFAREIATVPGVRVRVLVSDNASTDGTRELVAGFRARYPFIDYIRNETNIGAGPNIRKLMEHAETEYLWFFSDDERPHPGALRRVIELIAQTRASTYSFAFAPHLMTRPGPAVETDTLLALANRYGLLNIIGCLPTVMVRTARLRMIDMERYRAGVFIQTCVPFEAYAHEPAVLVRETIVDFPEPTAEDKLDNQRRWMAEGTLLGYFNLADAAQHWFQSGVITTKLETEFFKTTPNYLWDRYTIIMLMCLLNGRQTPTPEMITAVPRLADLLKDERLKRRLKAGSEQMVFTINTWITAHNLLSREMSLAEEGYGDEYL